MKHPTKRPVRVFEVQEIIDLFSSGKDTFEIANVLNVAESDVYNVLAFAKAAKEAFGDNSVAPLPPIRKPPVAGF